MKSQSASPASSPPAAASSSATPSSATGSSASGAEGAKSAEADDGRTRYRVVDDSGRIAGRRVKKRQIVRLTADEAKYLAPPHGTRVLPADAPDEDGKD